MACISNRASNCGSEHGQWRERERERKDCGRVNEWTSGLGGFTATRDPHALGIEGKVNEMRQSVLWIG